MNGPSLLCVNKGPDVETSFLVSGQFLPGILNMATIKFKKAVDLIGCEIVAAMFNMPGKN